MKRIKYLAGILLFCLVSALTPPAYADAPKYYRIIFMCWINRNEFKTQMWVTEKSKKYIITRMKYQAEDTAHRVQWARISDKKIQFDLGGSRKTRDDVIVYKEWGSYASMLGSLEQKVWSGPKGTYCTDSLPFKERVG